jgi:hypothetical protein
LQTVLAHGFNMCRPRIDQSDVVPGARHVRTGIAAHRACADYCDTFIQKIPLKTNTY